MRVHLNPGNCVVFLLALGIMVRPSHAEVVDQVAAVVNDRVITLSDLQWSFINSRDRLPDDPAEKRKALDARLDQLIEQEFVAQEVEKETLVVVREEEVEGQFRKLEARYCGRQRLEAEASRSGFSAEQLRVLIRRQLSVVKFIDFRFRPFIIVLPDEIATYYRDTLTPQLKNQGVSELPPVDQVREQIEKLLTEQKVDEELRKWISATRKRARIVILLNREESPNMPPEKWKNSKR